MTYPVHWVWLGGRLPDGVKDNIRAWIGAAKGFNDQIQPILWVDNGAWNHLRDQGELAAADNELGEGVISTRRLNLPNLADRVRVAVVNIQQTAGDGWVDPLGVLNHAGVPHWDVLGPAVQDEITDVNGLKQVASDIVRIAVLWLLEGAYWDLGDSAPGSVRFGLASLRERLARGQASPAVIPQVLPHAGTHRTENGIIVTHPDGDDGAATARYAAMIDAMHNRYNGGLRSAAAQAQVQAWRDTTRGRLASQILRDTTFRNDLAEGDAIRALFATRIQVETTLNNGLNGVTNAGAVDDAVMAALLHHPQTEWTISKLLWATVKENEAQYFRYLCDALCGEVDIGNLMQRISLTVSDFTFDAFVTQVGQQVPGDTLAARAGALYQNGWQKLETFFGGNTKIGSWYSWKTRPGRMLMAELARRPDRALNSATEWQPDQPQCSLCSTAIGTFYRHHCRRCGIFICGNCGRKVTHVQPAGSDAARAWDGTQWACLGCIEIISRR